MRNWINGIMEFTNELRIDAQFDDERKIWRDGYNLWIGDRRSISFSCPPKKRKTFGPRHLVIIANQFDKLAVYCIPVLHTIESNWMIHAVVGVAFVRKSFFSRPTHHHSLRNCNLFRGSHLLNRKQQQRWKQNKARTPLIIIILFKPIGRVPIFIALIVC